MIDDILTQIFGAGQGDRPCGEGAWFRRDRDHCVEYVTTPHIFIDITSREEGISILKAKINEWHRIISRY